MPDFAPMKKLLHFELMNWKKKKSPKPKRAFHLLALSIKIPSKYLAINYGCASFHITHSSWNLLLLWPEMSQFSSHWEPLNHSGADQEGISCSRVPNRQNHILNLLWGPLLFQSGLRGIFVRILVLPYGKGTWEEVRKDKLPSRKRFQVCIPAFGKMWKAAEGRELLMLSFPLFGKSCSKRWPGLRE